MPDFDQKKIQYADIGYHGKSIDTLTKEELLEAFLELAQTVVNCASSNNQCKAVFTVKQDRQQAFDADKTNR